ncbi:MAG: cytidylate kinase-like family protein, partial [Hungatella sp.]
MEYQMITISRQYGSGGRLIGAKLAERLQIPFYDKEIIALAAKQSGVSDQFFAQPEQTGALLLRDFTGGNAFGLPLGDQVYLAQADVIRTLAQKGPCVIVGRGAGAALSGMVSRLNVFVYADIAIRKRRVIEEYGEEAHKIEEYIAAIDKKRASYFKFYAGV